MSDEGAERGDDVLNEGEEAKEEEGKQAGLQLVGFYGFLLSQEFRRVFVQAHRATCGCEMALGKGDIAYMVGIRRYGEYIRHTSGTTSETTNFFTILTRLLTTAFPSSLLSFSHLSLLHAAHRAMFTPHPSLLPLRQPLPPLRNGGIQLIQHLHRRLPRHAPVGDGHAGLEVRADVLLDGVSI